MKKVFVTFFAFAMAFQWVMAQSPKKPLPPTAKSAPASKPVLVAPPANAMKTSKDSLSYAFGVSFGDYLKNVFKQQGIENPNIDLVLKGLSETLKNQTTALDPNACQGYIQSYIQNERMKVAKVQMEAGDKFLAENKTKAGVQSTPSGLQYQIIKEGTGAKPAATDQVKVHYHGTLTDGKVFDSSVDRGEPATFPVNGVIQGWVEALQLMPTGSKWKLFIPSGLGYGPQGTGGIPPNAVLVFEVELLEIVGK
jgi:FKBP-type peptidyl-prolyl cis-trans isomerase FklB